MTLLERATEQVEEAGRLLEQTRPRRRLMAAAVSRTGPREARYPADLLALAEDYLVVARPRGADRRAARLVEAMRYSLLAGGKRIRPVLTLSTARSRGADPATVLPTAAALELIHTYSLIHDDLPAIDDDDTLRRGRPTCHVAFGEDVERDPRRRRPLRGGLQPRPHAPGRRRRRRPRRAGRDRRGHGRAGHGGRPVHGRRRRGGGGRRPAHPARAQDRPPDPGRGGVRRAAQRRGGRGAGTAPSPPRSASSSRSSTTSSTRPAARRSWARASARTGPSTRSPTSRASAWTAPGASPRRPQGRATRAPRGPARRHLRPRRPDRVHPPPPPLTRSATPVRGARCYTPSTMRYLDKISDPADLQQFSERELTLLAGEVREAILACVSEVGGHLAASLGTVELTVALHSVLQSPHDKIVWDVGHQCYAHKLLTGRRDCFGTIRQYGGISGFPDAASRRTTSSAPATPRRPSATGSGSSRPPGWRALARQRRLRARRRGAHRRRRLRGAEPGRAPAHPPGRDPQRQRDVHPRQRRRPAALPQPHPPRPDAHSAARGHRARGRSHPGHRPAGLPPGQGRQGVDEGALVPGMLFEELGFAYIGVVDGHDMHALRESIRQAIDTRRPVVVHVKTVKGKGYEPAGGPARTPSTAPGPSTSATACRKAAAVGTTYTEAFGQALVRLAEADQRIVAITAAMAQGTGLEAFERRFPERFYDVGIAEEHAAVFAAGLAIGGMRPVVAIYSTFLQRAFDMLVQDIGLQHLPVIFAVDRAGLVGDDGPTHHGAFDLSFLRIIPNLTVMAPSSQEELQRMLRTALDVDGPVAIRYPRGMAAPFSPPERLEPLDVGEGSGPAGGPRRGAHRHRHRRRHRPRGGRVCCSAGRAPTVVDARFVKPLDVELLERLAATHRRIVTVEENALAGGFGSAVLEQVGQQRRWSASACPTPSCLTATAPVCCATSASRRRRWPPPRRCAPPRWRASSRPRDARAARRAARRPGALRDSRPGSRRHPGRRGAGRRADRRQARHPGRTPPQSSAWPRARASSRAAATSSTTPWPALGVSVDRRGRLRPGQLHRRLRRPPAAGQARRGWWPSTWATASSTGGCAKIRASP